MGFDEEGNYTIPRYTRYETIVIKFKMGVRKRLPKRILNATVCRKCVNTHVISDKCISCQIEQAKNWGRPY